MRTKPYATAIPLFDEVELLDVTGPISLLTGAGRQWNFQPFKIELVASALGPVATRSSLHLQATHTFDSAAEVECLIIPGGYGALPAANDPQLLSFIARAAERAEIVAAIGNGVWLLAKAGVLSGVEVAVPLELSAALTEECPTVLAQTTVQTRLAGKFLSASKSALGLDLACEIVSRTFGKKLASSLSAALGVGWSGELEGLEIVTGPLLGSPKPLP